MLKLMMHLGRWMANMIYCIQRRFLLFSVALGVLLVSGDV